MFSINTFKDNQQLLKCCPTYISNKYFTGQKYLYRHKTFASRWMDGWTDWQMGLWRGEWSIRWFSGWWI